MRNKRIILAVVGLIFLALAVAPVHALFIDGYVDGEDFINFVLFSPKPAYQKTAEDYIQGGNDWKEKCEAYSQSYDERLRAYVRQESLAQNRPAADINAGMKELQNPTAEQREYVMSSGFHQKDPQAQQYWNAMLESCAAAQKNYNRAYQMTDEDDYRQQAEIFNEGAGMYDAMGQTENADKMRQAAAVAGTHAAA
ncbi:MAG: hypothetical protein Q7J03_02925, partial [Methanoregula sp.]|nr:hypothetical protein [Methanoregula sp.]